MSTISITSTAHTATGLSVENIFAKSLCSEKLDVNKDKSLIAFHPSLRPVIAGV